MGEQKVEHRTGRHVLEKGYILNEKYEIVEVIGEGGFAVTYSGIRIEDEQRVAIKEYMPDRFIGGAEKSDIQAEKMVMRESDILKKYSYLDGIVTVLDTFAANNTVYIVMEFVEGITLAQYIRENGVFSYDELISLMEPIIKSLAQIHRQGVIHRDISPENIQIGLDNHFYLLDFGAAKQVSMLEHQNTVVFKNGYAPPEQYTGSGKQGSWTDVYALAATMYTALTGEILADSVSRLQDDDDKWLDKLGLLDGWQRQVLRKALSLKAADRYKNMEDFWLALTVRPDLEDRVTHVVAVPAKKKIFVGIMCAVILVFVLAGSGIMIALSGNSTKTNNSSGEVGRTNSTAQIEKETMDTETTEKNSKAQKNTGNTAGSTSEAVSTTENVGAGATNDSPAKNEDHVNDPEYTGVSTEYDATESSEKTYVPDELPAADRTTEVATEAQTREPVKEKTTEKTTKETATERTTEKPTSEAVTEEPTEKAATEKPTTETPTTDDDFSFDEGVISDDDFEEGEL